MLLLFKTYFIVLVVMSVYTELLTFSICLSLMIILGCFPTLATIPVFIGLYQALSNVANEVHNKSFC